MRYRSKPQEVEAVQWTGDNGAELVPLFNGKVCIETRGDGLFFCTLLTGKNGAQEWVPVPIGHWIVHPPGDFTDIWPVDDDYFRAKYESLSFIG